LGKRRGEGGDQGEFSGLKKKKGRQRVPQTMRSCGIKGKGGENVERGKTRKKEKKWGKKEKGLFRRRESTAGCLVKTPIQNGKKSSQKTNALNCQKRSKKEIGERGEKVNW